MPGEADIGKPVTRFRNCINMPQPQGLSHEGFKFPPTTPKVVRAPVWKLGSGFEGIAFEKLTKLKASKADRSKAKRMKYSCFQTPSIRNLELSTIISPSVQAKTFRKLSNGGLLPSAKTTFERSCQAPKHIITINPNETSPDTLNPDPGGEANLDKVRGLATPMRARIREADPKKSAILPSTQPPFTRLNRISVPGTRESENCQNIRKPSRSEREGWLKRRMKVSFVIEADRDVQKSEGNPPQEAHDDSAGNILDTHSATCYGEARARTQQTRPSQLLPRHATQAKSPIGSYKSNGQESVSFFKSGARLVEETR